MLDMLSRSPNTLRSKLRIRLPLIAVLVPVIAAGAALATGPRAHAEGAEADKAEANERCAIRLSIALVGKSAEGALLTNADPQTAVDAMVASPEFAERYARFVNSQFNGGPSTDAKDDPVYYLAKHVLTEKKPWTELFLGAYDVTATATAMEVKADPAGLGYFRSDAWRKRYAGNEPTGYMLVGAFRILTNTVGLTLTPSVGNPGDDRTANGRQAEACKGCHFENWYALDKFARLLPKKKVTNDVVTFTAPTEGAQALLGKTIADDKALVTSLVESDAWKFHQCRMVFEFLYGRSENQCEAKVFDACVEALDSKKTIQAAVSAVAKDPSFCK